MMLEETQRRNYYAETPHRFIHPCGRRFSSRYFNCSPDRVGLDTFVNLKPLCFIIEVLRRHRCSTTPLGGAALRFFYSRHSRKSLEHHEPPYPRRPFTCQRSSVRMNSATTYAALTSLSSRSVDDAHHISCAASCGICSPKCFVGAPGTSASWPNRKRPPLCHFAFICSRLHSADRTDSAPTTRVSLALIARVPPSCRAPGFLALS